MEKSAIFSGIEPGGTAILNIDSIGFDILVESARASGSRIVTFGSDVAADFRINLLGSV